jgi:hypothetical protein
MEFGVTLLYIIHLAAVTAVAITSVAEPFDNALTSTTYWTIILSIGLSIIGSIFFVLAYHTSESRGMIAVTMVIWIIVTAWQAFASFIWLSIVWIACEKDTPCDAALLCVGSTCPIPRFDPYVGASTRFLAIYFEQLALFIMDAIGLIYLIARCIRGGKTYVPLPQEQTSTPSVGVIYTGGLVPVNKKSIYSQ